MRGKCKGQGRRTWRDVAVMGDRGIQMKINVKMYKTVMYGTETWVLHKKEEQSLGRKEVRML